MDDFFPLRLPTLEILAAGGAVAEAASAAPPQRAQPYEEGTKLDPRLRRHLGVACDEWSDEHLLMVQRTALVWLAGEPIFVSDLLFELTLRAADLFVPPAVTRSAQPKTA